jgi:Mn-dependent DtxR family transcriptional regulator
MEFGNVLHMTQVRMAKALKVPPSQVSRALKRLEAVGLVACADQGTYVLSAEPGWARAGSRTRKTIELGLEGRLRLIRGEA